ncbi:MAG: division/cell wall cluster transcriptional repressor MraZ [Leeuwenhoekiella sp.]
MLNFLGTYECKMDAKGRIMMPSALKKQAASEINEGFVIKRSVFQPCLEIYPMAEWNVLMKKINGLNRFVKKNNDFIRKFTAGVKFVEVDASGRILIPKDLSAFAGLTKDVVLSSAVNIIEVWDLLRYEEAVQSEDDDFAALAEEVMGTDNEIPDGLS